MTITRKKKALLSLGIGNLRRNVGQSTISLPKSPVIEVVLDQKNVSDRKKKGAQNPEKKSGPGIVSTEKRTFLAPIRMRGKKQNTNEDDLKADPHQLKNKARSITKGTRLRIAEKHPDPLENRTLLLGSAVDVAQIVATLQFRAVDPPRVIRTAPIPKRKRKKQKSPRDVVETAPPKIAVPPAPAIPPTRIIRGRTKVISMLVARISIKCHVVGGSPKEIKGRFDAIFYFSPLSTG